jgi:hypothetical protein
MIDKLPNSIFASYFQECLTYAADLRSREPGSRLHWLLGNEAAHESILLVHQIDNFHHEMCVIVKRFEVANGEKSIGPVRAEEVRLNEKLYIISWWTLSDLIAGLINKVFDLGLADEDVKFTVVMRNKHVMKSDLPAIIKKYTKPLQIPRLRKQRDDIVHRGKIIDEEIENVYRAWATLQAENDRQGGKGHNQMIARQIDEFTEIALRKRATYEAHYLGTVNMVHEILGSLARRTVETYKQHRTADVNP